MTAAASPATLAGVRSRFSPERRTGRAVPRVPHRVACRVRVQVPGTGEWHDLPGRTVNVSRHGLAVQVGVDLAPGTHLEACLPGPDERGRLLAGRVVHARRILVGTYEIGVEFDAEGR